MPFSAEGLDTILLKGYTVGCFNYVANLKDCASWFGRPSVISIIAI